MGRFNPRFGFWTGATWPLDDCGAGGGPCPHPCSTVENASCTVDPGCGDDGYCLFDLDADPEERTDLSAEPSAAATLHQLQARLAAVVATAFQTTDSEMEYSDCATTWTANVAAHRGFAAPMCKTATPKKAEGPVV